ncbi:YicC/YloC family endoribonuclease [Wenyingzhuangia sp. 2_MG-2023]|uniref:YicC/YloC family endoribonuclease n=1 Tax=Wenyingzhuangia sp. 2_MG-2023 TaxID=3062639 RepID=UPI0026E4485B|nr:YicC/YloC family endoribonuclease [Wenyingzhuangia sp. 2_MG-2023]MDO6737724.1 YicC/YloC family endoribonuclease [Wenyingzhuangia sp. 2_MG-2023]
MIQSMTGYGKAIVQLPTKKVTIEIKSLNSKLLDLNVRIPQYYKEKEINVRKTIAKSVVRGKVDFSIYVEMTSEISQTKVNVNVVSGYMNQLKEIATGSDVEFLDMAMRLPDALKTEREELDPTEWALIEGGVDEAIAALVKFRKDEAESLEVDFRERIQNIQNLAIEVNQHDDDRMIAVKEKLRKAIDDLQVTVDENRFEQELIYYLEKLDINEEKVRLANHLEYFLKELNSEVSDGKKLGFIVQEIGREINTTGSKSNYAPMQQVVVQMKNELEKIKEQILNVL